MDASPIVAGLVAGVAAFAVVAFASGDDPDRRLAAAEPAAVASVTEGRSVFARFGCGTCHTLSAADARGGVGPNLDKALTGFDRDALAAKIADPYAGGAPTGFETMPTDFADRMTDRELDALVSFLLESRVRDARR